MDGPLWQTLHSYDFFDSWTTESFSTILCWWSTFFHKNSFSFSNPYFFAIKFVFNQFFPKYDFKLYCCSWIGNLSSLFLTTYLYLNWIIKSAEHNAKKIFCEKIWIESNYVSWRLFYTQASFQKHKIFRPVKDIL